MVSLVHRTAPPPSEWPAPYSGLAERRYFPVDIECMPELEVTIERLCGDLGLPYFPLPSDDPQLPFLARFDAEMDRRCPQREERYVGIYRRLMEVRHHMVQSYADGDYERALSLTHYFVSACEYEFPAQRFYYPYVALAVFQTLSGRTREALDCFLGLLGHPDVDESTYAGIGYIRECQGAYAEAVHFYGRAAARDAADPISRRGVILNSLYTGRTGNLDASMEELLRVSRTPAELARAKDLIAFVKASRGDSKDALRLYAELAESGNRLANYLAGRRERADYDFQRSGHAPEDHYAKIVPGVPGRDS